MAKRCAKVCQSLPLWHKTYGQTCHLDTAAVPKCANRVQMTRCKRLRLAGHKLCQKGHKRLAACARMCTMRGGGL